MLKFAFANAQADDLYPATSRINTVILDEAGTSPESKMPVLLLLPALDNIIAIGDQLQLQPFTHLEDPVSNKCFAFAEKGCVSWILHPVMFANQETHGCEQSLCFCTLLYCRVVVLTTYHCAIDV